MNSEKYSTTEFVCKIIGPINPVGETRLDNARFDNLKEMTELVLDLLRDLKHVETDHNLSSEFSSKRAVDHIQNFFNDVREEIA